MTALGPALAVCILMGALLSLVHVYLYAVDRRSYLLYWSLAWAVYAFRFVVQIILARFGLNIGFPLILLSTLPSMLLMMGAFGLCGAHMPRGWLWGLAFVWAFTLATAWTHTLSTAWTGTAPSLFIAAMFLATAWLIARARIATASGRSILAVTFVAWAVHNATYSLLLRYPAFMPWGYALGAVLALTAALTTVMLHFHTARAELAASESYFRTLFESTRDAILITSRKGEWRVLDVNPALVDLLGYSREELIGHRARFLYVPGAYDDFTGTVYPEVAKLGSWRGEWPFVAKDGTRLLTETTIAPLRNGAMPQDAHIAILRDITQRKQMEEAIRIERDRARVFLDVVGVSVVAIDRAHCVTLINREGLRLLGYEDADIRGKDWFDVSVPPEHREDLRMQHGRTLAEAPEGILQREYPVATIEGEMRIVAWRTVVLRDERGTATGTLSSGEDITDRRRDEILLRRLAAAVEQATELIFVIDTEGRIAYVNPAFSAVTGFAREEAEGMQTPTLLHCRPDVDGGFERLWHMLKVQPRWRGHCRSRKKDGEDFDADMTITAIRDHKGAVSHYVVVQRDITRETQLEQALLHAQKMEAIGTLAGGIAHDFNNILGAILGYGELALLNAEPDSRAASDIQEVLRAGGRAQALVRQILTFSRKTSAARAPFLLDQVIDEAIQLVRGGLPANIEVSTQLAKCPPVLGDASQFLQVIMNLCTNAYHAMRPGGGKLTIGLAVSKIDELRARELEVVPGNYARVTVADTGVGISSELLPRIFEPYFTTKELGEGTGLGLATVHGIVRGHQGAIHVSSAMGEGTSVIVYLPVTEFCVETEVSATTRDAAPRGHERILFVDDEPTLVQLAVQGLSALGYTVRGCHCAEEALETLRQCQGEFDLVVSDQMMPGMNGTEFARRVIEEYPQLPVILCTGFSEAIHEERAREAGIKRFLHKPLLTSSLSKNIRAVLDTPKP